MFFRVIDAVRRTAEWISVVLLFAMFAVSLAGVAMRYVFNSPLSWSDELGMVMLLWAVFVADAFVTKDQDHIAFDMAWDVASPPLRRVILLLQAGLFCVLFAVAIPTVVDYILFLWRERTSALEWRLDFVYSCFAIYLVALVLRLAAKFVRAAGPDWRREVTDGDATQTANILG